MRFNCAAGHDQTNIDSAGEGGNVVLDFIGEMTPGQAIGMAVRHTYISFANSCVAAVAPIRPRNLLGERGMGRRLVEQIGHRFPLIRFVAVMALVTAPALGRDLDGRYSDAPLRDWFNHLASQKGLCCSFADGYIVEDADWMSQNGHYRVRVPKAAGSKDMIWVEVPDEAVIKEPNKIGRTMVWPLYDSESVSIRCFMPGTMT